MKGLKARTTSNQLRSRWCRRRWKNQLQSISCQLFRTSAINTNQSPQWPLARNQLPRSLSALRFFHPPLVMPLRSSRWSPESGDGRWSHGDWVMVRTTQHHGKRSSKSATMTTHVSTKTLTEKFQIAQLVAQVKPKTVVRFHWKKLLQIAEFSIFRFFPRKSLKRRREYVKSLKCASVIKIFVFVIRVRKKSTRFQRVFARSQMDAF